MKLENVVESSGYRIYVDIDGVLADFDAGIFDLMGERIPSPASKEFESRMFAALKQHTADGQLFWETLDKLKDADMLWRYVKRYNPIVLSSIGDQDAADGQKRRWIAKHFGRNTRVELVRTSAEKAKYATSTSILIDDRSKSIDPWVSAGGIGILHTSASNTITELKKLGL